MYTPQRTIVRFAAVSISRTVYYKDTDGKKRQITQRFMQTINPFNKNGRGEPKDRQEILIELRAQADLWALKTKNDLRDGRTAA